MNKIFLAFIFSVATLFANELKIGDYLPFEHCKNQFDQSMIIDKNTKLLIVTFSKDKGAVLKEFLEKNKKFLTKRNAYYMADVSGVPSFVMSMFMKPKFKSYDYEMGLIYDEKKALGIPKKDDLITVIHLKNKKVRKIEFKDKLDYLNK